MAVLSDTIGTRVVGPYRAEYWDVRVAYPSNV